MSEFSAAIIVGIIGSFAFALIALFFILLNRFFVHAKEYERSNSKNLRREAKYVWHQLYHTDRKLILTAFGVSWALFFIINFSIFTGADWIVELEKVIDKAGDFLVNN